MNSDQPGVRGILAGVDRLDIWLHAAFAVLLVASAVRYVAGHGLGDQAAVVLPVAALLLAMYAVLPRVAWPAAWFFALVGLWVVLVVLAPSFSWCAVPLAFVGLQVLPFRAAVVTIGLMTTVTAVAW